MPEEYLDKVRNLYDRVTASFVENAGDTIQAGLIPTQAARGAELPRASNLFLADRAGVKAGERLLDTGCGVGGPSLHIAQAWPDVTIDAVTVSPVQAEMARKNLAEAGVADRVTVHELDYHRLPFEDSSFDLVFFLESTGYAYDVDALFEQMFRLLRPGGRIYIKDLFAVDGPWSHEELAELEGVNELWAQHCVPTKEDWAKRLAAAGFEDLQVERLHEANSHYYFGAMFNADFTLNKFGKEFFRSFPSPDLVHYGDIRGRKPEAL